MHPTEKAKKKRAAAAAVARGFQVGDYVEANFGSKGEYKYAGSSVFGFVEYLLY